MSTWPEPRKTLRTGNFPYKFKITGDYTYRSDWQLETEYCSQWLHISATGLITVKGNNDGYAWDGCTPKCSVLNLFIMGTPDGHVDHRTMKPYTYYASLIHDALYQYLDSIPVSKDQVDLLFLEMLGDFKLRKLYYLFVKHFGGRGVVQVGLSEAKID